MAGGAKKETGTVTHKVKPEERRSRGETLRASAAESSKGDNKVERQALEGTADIK